MKVKTGMVFVVALESSYFLKKESYSIDKPLVIDRRNFPQYDQGTVKREEDILELPLGGLYHLVIQLRRLHTLQVGALGLQRFPIGTYVYTGSVKRGLLKRINRPR